MAAIAVRDTAGIAKKYAQRAQAAGGDYAIGVKSPARDWAQNTQAAAEAYKAGVTAAAGRGAFEKGVAAAGTARWQAKAVKVGPGRYGEGVAGAEGDYATGVGPYLDALKGFDAGPRGPAGSPQNAQRSAAVAALLHRKKTGQ